MLPVTIPDKEFKEISSSYNGSCIYSIIVPYIKSFANNSILLLFNFSYVGKDEVMFVNGIERAQTFFTFNEKASKEWVSAGLENLFVSIIIPPNGNLQLTYSSDVFIQQINSFPIDEFTEAFHTYHSSPNYPNYQKVDGFIDNGTYECKTGLAAYTIILTADIPESCFLIFYPDNQIPTEISGINITNHIYYINATKVIIVFNGSTCADEYYHGYGYQLDAEYIRPVKDQTQTPNYPLIIGLSSTGFVIACICVIAFSVYWIMSRQRRYDQIYKLLKEMNLTPEEMAEMKAKSDQLLIKPGKVHINFDNELGKGAFSTVYKGHLIGPSPLHEQENSVHTQQYVDCDVAVKVTNKFGQDEVEELFKEIDAMKTIKYHENVMCMLGWSMSSDTPCLVFEMAVSDLIHYVSEFRDFVAEEVPYKTFLLILKQITKGMQYIASKGLVHRDLAARNVLLFDNCVAKISDFGLCCNADDYFSLSTKLPIKWLALEALIHRRFSEKSDVWSFGVLMYEVYTFGKIPYVNKNADELIVFLQSGERLEKPENMDDVCYEIMLSCWNKDYDARPSFMELEERIE